MFLYMKTFEQMGVKIPEILLPKNIQTETWSVVACDQYTQDRAYWEKVADAAAGKPSTLNIILPEVYLNDESKQERIKNIRNTMEEYLDSGVFAPCEPEMIYIERKTAYGRTRRGLVTCIDLETYEWKPFSKSLIRATEATIVERIPPRMEIRRGAAIESPHIMLLANDESCSFIEGVGERAKNSKPVYSGSLMQKSGEITGWAVKTNADLDFARSELVKLFEKNTDSDGSTFLFAVGDGNHSLATAKAVWEEFKKENPATPEDSPVRYALVEIVNIYDRGLTFEPIHRVLFNMDAENLVENLKDAFSGKVVAVSDSAELAKKVRESSADFGFSFMKDGRQKFVLLSTEIQELAVSRLQPVLDSLVKSEKEKNSSVEMDYIHGEAEVFRLGKKDNAVGVLLPPVCKDSFFATINQTGPLPRKSFSMGEADEKRFYLECRKLFAR